MNLTIKKKNELLDYAIERINQYDEAREHRGLYYIYSNLPTCLGCLHASVSGYGECSICPFAIDCGSEIACRPRGQWAKTPKDHQSDLIKAVNKWCEKFYPEFKVVRV